MLPSPKPPAAIFFQDGGGLYKRRPRRRDSTGWYWPPLAAECLSGRYGSPFNEGAPEDARDRPNPDFNEAAASKWNPDRYYNDPKYYYDQKLVRPYRVGMSCGFCHVGPNPTNPPADPENPKWANLNSNPGAQYFWVDRIFIWNPRNVQASFVFQLFHTSLPGSLDTSFVSTDYINNPRTMNAVYNVAARLEAGRRFPEKLEDGGSAFNKQFNDYPQMQALAHCTMRKQRPY